MRALIRSARDALVRFVTSEWVSRAAGLVEDILDTVRELAPGQTLGEAFPEAFPAPSQPSTSTLIPPIARSVAPSPVVAPPMSATPSSSSGVSRLSQISRLLPSEPGVDPAARRVRPLPRAAYRQSSGPPAIEPSPLPETPAVVDSAPAIPPITIPAPRPRRVAAVVDSASAIAAPPAPVPARVPTPQVVVPPAPATRAKRKRSAADSAVVAKPQKCARCKHRKKGCFPPEGGAPPFDSCALCLKESATCSWGGSTGE
jgi:hypothetical protein